MQRTIIQLCTFLQTAITADDKLIFFKAKDRKLNLCRRIILAKIISVCLVIMGVFSANILNAQTVDFTISITDSCVPATAKFTDVSTGSGGVLSRTWDLANGNFPTASPVGANYLTDSTYNIKLTVTFVNGVTKSLTKQLIVHPLPVAKFGTVEDTVGCSPLNVKFKDLSTTATGSITEWFWDLDVTTSNQQNPTQQYTAINTYKITLYVVNSWGCKSQLAVKDDYIQVIDKPVVNFTYAPQNTCKDTLTVFFTNNSTNAPNPFWTFGDRTTSTQVNPAHFYNKPGSDTVKLRSIAAPNCGDSLSKIINIGTPKAKIISAPDTVCEKTSYSFTGSGTPVASCKWIFLDKPRTLDGCSVSYSFDNPGLYEVLFIAYNSWGCADTVRKNIFVKASPNPAFTIDTAKSCKWPFVVQAVNLTQDRSLKFTWNFGDGSPLITAVDPPPHTYNGYNNYTISLTAEDVQTGCKTTIVKVDTVRIVRPTVTLLPNLLTNCLPPQDFTFTAFPNFAIDPAIQFVWKFDDGTPDVTTNIPTLTHTYIKSGTFTVKVTATSKNDCSAFNQTSFTLFDTCIKQPKPLPVIFATYNCNTCNQVTLKDTVSDATIISWDMGYNNVVLYTNASTITHLYPFQSGNFTVTVTRVNNGDTSRTQIKIEIICLTPSFTLSKRIACISDSIHFIPVGLDSSLVSNYTWTSNNSVIGIVNNPNLPPYKKGDIYYQYNQLGSYVIKLTITDKKNCTRTSQTDTILIQGPRPDFTAQPRTTCDTAFTVFFKDSTTLNANILIVKWQWKFGDNSTYTTTKDTIIPKRYSGNTVPPSKVYNVTLSVTDSVGCSNTITKSSYIKMYRPKADFSSGDTVQCNRYAASFTNKSQAANATYIWHFGDGTDSNAVSPSHTYPAGDGEYNVTLIVKDENGCIDSIQKPKYIKFVHPEANMRIRDTGQCWPVQIRFDDSSKYAKSFLWNFGDGSATQTIPSPKKNYANPGTYTVTLIVTGPNGCKDTTSQSIKIKGAKGDLWQGTLAGCKPFDATLKVINKNNIDSFAWDWNDGSVIIPKKDDSVATHLYPKAGKYLPNVIIISSEGCRYSLKAKDPFIVDSAKALFSATPLFSCAMDSVRVTNLSTVPDFSTITKYTWNWGDGSTSNAANPVQHVYSLSGVYPIQLAIESKYGCRDTFRLPEAVKIFSPPKLFIAGKDSACQKSTLNFKSQIQSSDSVKTIQWFFNGGVAGNDTTISLRFDSPGTFLLSLNVTTRYGCNATVTKKVTIFPVPVPKAAPDTTICVNSSLRLRAFDGVNYLWTPAATLSNPNSATPLAKPPAGITNYVVTVLNGFGCETKDTVTIKVDDSIYLRTVSPAEVCRGDSITLNASANTKTFLWSPANGLSNTSIANPVASPADTTLYTLVGFSNNTCPHDSGFLWVNVKPVPQVKAKANPLQTTPGSEVMLISTGSGDVINYNWMPASKLLNARSNATFWQYPDTSTTFMVAVRNQSGCIASAVVRVEVICANSSVVVPSAFTPGGKNPYFRPLGLYKSDPKLIYFRVFDRWGQLVYHAEDLNASAIKGWDGRVNGTIQGSAVFVWIIEVACIEGKVMKKGTVALIR